MLQAYRTELPAMMPEGLGKDHMGQDAQPLGATA